ncbi:hypothetical protein B0H19DRAFT_1129786 [Mycena capillaripes]|nr:hypothetical protein B0H19DRAFT_1129786 [Mycena capillaripes]
MATLGVSRELKSLSKKSYCHKCQATKHLSELKICSRCQSAKYCSKACQKAHWKTHKPHCKSPEDVKLEPVDESWNNVFASHGHKRAGVLEPVTETLQQQSDRLHAWTDKWKPTILSWAFWAMNIPSSSTPEDRLSKFTFVFELQRRANPPTPAHYLEVPTISISISPTPLFSFLALTPFLSQTFPSDARRRNHAHIRPNLPHAPHEARRGPRTLAETPAPKRHNPDNAHVERTHPLP